MHIPHMILVQFGFPVAEEKMLRSIQHGCCNGSTGKSERKSAARKPKGPLKPE
jgi:hypothetical protein